MRFLVFAATLVFHAVAADQTVILKIDGMMCPSCAKTVKESLSGVAGVKSVNVYLKDGKADLLTDGKSAPSQMCDAVKKAGYGCNVVK